MKTLYRITCTVTLLASFWCTGLAQAPLKREFRAAWIATVTNLDWPSTPGGNPQTQRDQLVSILDQLMADGINAVVFQVRPECDALYRSSIEPWSYYLTGAQGSPPNPEYDPLQFALDEAHKRGMELHAWFNPYRAVRSAGSYSLAPTHVSVAHPDWILSFPAAGGQPALKILDPGLPQVREYVSRIIADIVRRYDVDGVHADDYFYPYPPQQITNQDDSTFARYNRGFSNRGNWRRDNVNLLMKQITDSINAVKPYVKFGMSPFGIWKNGVPPGITGLDAYNDIYGDAMAWLQQHSVDYLAPQLYWRIGGGQDFSKLMPWWADSTGFYGRHLYIGHIFGSYSTSELPNQLRLNRGNANVQGSIWFRASNLISNTLGFADSLKRDLYRNRALLPIMKWKDSIPPNPVQNLRYERLASADPAAFRWDLPVVASDGDTASRYAVYRFDHSPILPGELNNPQNIAAVEGRRYSIPPTPPTLAGPYYYVVTSLDRNYNEGPASTVLTVSPPQAPALAGPANAAQNQPMAVTLSWRAPGVAASYRLQVSSDPSFATGLIVNDSTIADTFKVVTGMKGQQTYYWRVGASNAGGTSSYSSSWSFVTGFPAVPLLATPVNLNMRAATNMFFRWHPAPGASSYQFQMSEASYFLTTVVDTSSLVDTSLTVNGLQVSKVYFWRVRASNAIGLSEWSEKWGFKTDTIATGIAHGLEVPSQYGLSQNYPNPFNPLTMISFRIPMETKVSLRVYNVLGEEVRVLVDDIVPPGEHNVVLNASELPSGVYFYRLIAGGYVETRKMSLLK